MGDVKIDGYGGDSGSSGAFLDYPVGNADGNVRGHHGHHGSVFRRVAQENWPSAPAARSGGNANACVGPRQPISASLGRSSESRR